MSDTATLITAFSGLRQSAREWQICGAETGETMSGTRSRADGRPKQDPNRILDFIFGLFGLLGLVVELVRK